MQDEKRVPFWAGGAPGLNAAVIQYLEKNITITVLSNFGPPTAENVGRQIKSIIDNGNYQPPQIPLQEKIYKTYLEKGSDYIEKNFNELITGYPIIGTKDQIINQIGYNLM